MIITPLSGKQTTTQKPAVSRGSNVITPLSQGVVTPQPQQQAPTPTIAPIATKPTGIISRAKRAVSDVKEYYGYKPKETIIENLKFGLSQAKAKVAKIEAPKIKAPEADRERTTGFLESVVEDSPPVVGTKIIKESARDVKDFLSGITGAWSAEGKRMGGQNFAPQPEAKFTPKGQAQKFGVIAYDLMKFRVTTQAGGQSEVIQMGTQMFSGAIKASPLLSPKVAFVQDTLGKFASKQFARFLNRIKPFNLTFDEAVKVTTGKGTPEQIAKYQKVVEYSEQSGISMSDILAKSAKMKVKPSTKIHDFIKNSVESIKKILNSSLTKEEQKLLTASVKSQLEQVVTPGEYTSQELSGMIITNALEKTAGGKQIMKIALEAQKTGQSIVVDSALKATKKPTKPIEAKPEGVEVVEAEEAKIKKKPLIETSRPIEGKKPVAQGGIDDTYGTVKEWGTRNQYVANNPFRKQLDAMKATKKFDMDILKEAERWELEQVLKDKPAFLSDNLSAEEIIKFARKNKLWFRRIKGSDGLLSDVVVGKDINRLNRTLTALSSGDQRELGLSLGYEDLLKKSVAQPGEIVIGEGFLESLSKKQPRVSPLKGKKLAKVVSIIDKPMRVPLGEVEVTHPVKGTNAFWYKDKRIKLTDEQKRIVLKEPSPLPSPIKKPVPPQARKGAKKPSRGVVKKVKIARKPLVKKKRLKLQEKVKNVIMADTQAEAVKAVEGFVDKSLLDRNNKELKAIRAEFNRQMFEIVGAETGNRKRDFAFLQVAKKDPQISELIDSIEDQIVKIDTAIEFSIPKNKDKVFFLRRSPETDPVTSGIKPVQSPEELIKRIEQLNKFAQSNAILRRTGKIKDKRAVGQFVSKGKEGEVRLRAKFIANDSDYVEVLAHELSHAIEYQLTGGIDKDTYKVFGDKLDDKTIKTIEKELKAVTQELAGGEITKRNEAYYYKPSELLARFLQKKFVSPGNLSDIAPTANDLLEQQAIKHPMIREFLEAANNEIDKGVSKFRFLPDLRQTYQKHLGKRVGNIAYDEEVTHRAMQERGKFVVEKFVKGKFKNIKDDSATLFRAAEAIKTTKDGKPEFGTRDFVTAKNKQGAKKLADSGWEEVRVEMKDGKDLPVYARERYTPQEAEAIFESLSPEGKQLIKDFTAERKEAKDYFNRELIKDNNEIKGNIEGWVHHFFEDGKGPKSEGGLKFKKRQAGVRKKRTGKEGYVEDFKKSMTKVLTDLEGEKVFNDFITRQFSRVTKPIPEGKSADPGWVEVVGELERGVGTQREKKVVIIKDGKSFVPKRTRFQMPKDIHNRYKLWKGLIEEASTAVKVVNNINRYWRINVLAHAGTATTNFISGGIQYSTKILTDFYTETLTGNLAYKKTRTNVAVMLKTLLPKGWSEADDWVYGSDLSNWYGQFTTKSAVPKTIDSYGNKALKLFGTYERYWKKVISLSEGTKDLKSLNKMTKEGLRLPTKAERQLIADINREVDLYAYDYANVPVWLEAHQRSVIGQTIKPFAKYPYKYAKHVTNLAGAAFDRSLPWQTRVSKLLALSTVVALYAAYSKKRREKQETPLPTERVPERLSTRGRLFIRTKDGKEVFARVSKYPFVNLSQAGLEVVDGSWESAKDLVSEMLGSIGPGGKAAALAFGYRHDYDKWKPVPALLGENLVSFVPGFRILNDVSRALDPYRRKQSTFLESFGSIIPTTNEDLQRKLHGEIRTFRVPIEGDIKRKEGESRKRTTTDRMLRNYWQDILVSMLSGIYQSRIDPKEVEAIIIREEKNRKEAEKNQ